MLTLLRTWQMGDISKIKTVSQSLQGDLAGVLKTVTAKALVMPCKTDLYFPVGDPKYLHGIELIILLLLA